jgi:lysophospholipase L1-like esterase
VILLVGQITPLNPGPPQKHRLHRVRVPRRHAQLTDSGLGKQRERGRISRDRRRHRFGVQGRELQAEFDYTTDGVHPNVAGAQLIANKWLAALTALGAP